MSRPLLRAVEAQQQVMAKLARENEVMRLQLAYLARVAGLSPQFAAIRKECDADNPAQPVPNPPSQSATESTEETLAPLGNDNPNTPGQTQGVNDGVAAETTATPMDVGTTIPTQPYNNLVDVTAPVSGTETHVPNEQTRIETDVRVGDPMNPETAFPLNPAWGPSQQSPAGPPKSGEMSQTGARNRALASLKLAKLRLHAGLAQGDEFSIAASIESDRGLSDRDISTESRTLEGIVTNASKRQQRPSNLVPKSANQQNRVSLQATGSVGHTTASNTGDDAEDIFL